MKLVIDLERRVSVGDTAEDNHPLSSAAFSVVCRRGCTAEWDN
jgi:hypothetical protein